jgi:hypothetical protein
LLVRFDERGRAYPVLRHALLSGQPFQAVWPFFDTKERAEVVLVEITTRNLLAVVAHELQRSNGQHVESSGMLRARMLLTLMTKL